MWPIAEIQTFALRVIPSVSEGPGGAGGAPEEIAAFLTREGQRRHLFPLRTVPEDIVITRRNGAIAGVAALWDQRAYKQSVVRGYSGWLRAAATFTRRLPRVGEALRTVYATMICVENDDRAVFAELMRELMARAHACGAEYVIAGFDARDPLLPVVRSMPHHLYRSRFYLASWTQGDQLHDLLDHRPVYADVATL